MKKLMAILFVLALVNVANAGYLDLQISSRGGCAIRPIQEVSIYASDVIGVDVVYTPSPGRSIFSISKEIVITPSADMTASIGGIISTPINPGTLTWPTGWCPELSQVTIISDRRQGQVGDPLIDTAANDIGSVAPGIVLGHFLLHCDGFSTAVVKLVENPNTYVAGESLEFDGNWNCYHLGEGPGIIIQCGIPEPMTLTLLVLGGLAILRKRRA
jgi:hypothetical protein